METGRREGMGPGRVKLLYFGLGTGICAKAHFFSRVRIPLVEIGTGEGEKILCCPVPEFYIKNRNWEEEKLTACLNGVIHGVACEEYYLRPEVAGMAGVEERMPPEYLLAYLLRQVPCMEYLCCIGWEEEQELLQGLLEPYFLRINHVNVVTDRLQAYEGFAEYIYAEYGTPLSGSSRLDGNLGRKGRTVILDGRKDYRIPWPVFPEGTVYVDCWSAEGKRELLGKHRRDMKYLSVVKFLDTAMKSGYNTRVNVECHNAQRKPFRHFR